jgi:hypothetical protein
MAQTPRQAAVPARPPVSLHASYNMYAAGLEVADVDAGFSTGPWNYQMSLAYHTTGMVGFFFRGHNQSTVRGAWHGLTAAPLRFLAKGVLRGEDRLTEIDYLNGQPAVGELVPPNDREREPVPENLRTNTIDTLSALMQLMHAVDQTGGCDTEVHTYDGRRAVDIKAYTVGEEVLEPTGRSSFAGSALHCDFVGRMQAGFKFDGDRERDARPLHGSAWLAPVSAGGPPMPVRMAFETRWFGNATMYLTGVGPGAELTVARGN